VTAEKQSAMPGLNCFFPRRNLREITLTRRICVVYW
jgi:hypothetical protein